MPRHNINLCLFPFAESVSANVQRFPKAREPTVRAAKGCPPPFTRDPQPRPRWPRPRSGRRGKHVLADVRALDQRSDSTARHPGESETLLSGRRAAAAAVDHQSVYLLRAFPLTFCACRRPESRPTGRRRAVHRPSSRLISPPAVASGRRPRRGKSVLAAGASNGCVEVRLRRRRSPGCTPFGERWPYRRCCQCTGSRCMCATARISISLDVSV